MAATHGRKKKMLWGILNYSIHYVADVLLQLVQIFMHCLFDSNRKQLISPQAILLNTKGLMSQADKWSMI